jgi:chorismate-pyruvate lyase
MHVLCRMFTDNQEIVSMNTLSNNFIVTVNTIMFRRTNTERLTLKVTYTCIYRQVLLYGHEYVHLYFVTTVARIETEAEIK